MFERVNRTSSAPTCVSSPRAAWWMLPNVSAATSSARPATGPATVPRSEEHTSELQSLMRISYAVFCLNKTKERHTYTYTKRYTHRTHQRNTQTYNSLHTN